MREVNVAIMKSTSVLLLFCVLSSSVSSPSDEGCRFRAYEGAVLSLDGSRENSETPLLEWRWNPITLKQCPHFKLYDIRDAQILLARKSILFIGDSIVRDQFVSVLSLLEGKRSEFPDFKGHRDFAFNVGDDTQLKFIWAPFIANLTDHFTHSANFNGLDMIVVSSGLWDILWTRDFSHFEEHVEVLLSILCYRVPQRVPIFWKQMPLIVTDRMGSKETEKRTFLTPHQADVYERAVENAIMKYRYNNNNNNNDNRNNSNKSNNTNNTVIVLREREVIESSPLKEQATPDGVHIARPLVELQTQLLLNSFASPGSHNHANKMAQRSAPNAPNNGNSIHTDNDRNDSGKNDKRSTTPLYVGGDALLGAVVGLYVLLALITGDSFIVAHLALSLFGKEEEATPHHSEQERRENE